MILKKNAASKRIQKFKIGNKSFVRGQLAEDFLIRRKKLNQSSSIKAVNMDASQLINKEQKFSLVSSPQKNLIRSGYLEKFKIGSKTKTSDSTNDQQKKIRVSNIILENIKNRSRSNEHKANTSKDTNQTELYENDDYCIKPGLIKFIKANPALCSCIYSNNEVSRNFINAYDNCISSAVTGIL